MTTPTTPKRKLMRKISAAKHRLAAWFAADMLVIMAAAETLQANLSSLDPYLNGWGKVVVACGVSALVAALRIRLIAKKGDE